MEMTKKNPRGLSWRELQSEVTRTQYVIDTGLEVFSKEDIEEAKQRAEEIGNEMDRRKDLGITR